MAADLFKAVLVVLFVSLAAFLTNTSPFVWGPNVVYLLEHKRPFARSIAFTIGRALTLFVAGVAIVAILFATGQGVSSLVEVVQNVAGSSSSATYILIGVVLLLGSIYIVRRPPSFFDTPGGTPALAGSDRLWPAFAVGIGVAVPNILSFVWQTAILGGAVVWANGDWFLAGVFVIVWTLFGTADLWGVLLARMFAPTKTTVWLEKMQGRVPSVTPGQVGLSVAVVGMLFLGYGVLKVVGS